MNRTAYEIGFKGMNALMKAMLRGWKVDDWFYWPKANGDIRLHVALVYKDNHEEAKTMTMVEL